MNLPNYFLADLPADAVLTPSILSEACDTLKVNREKYLRQRSTRSLVDLLCEVSDNWTEPHYPFRNLALDQGPRATGFSRTTLSRGLNSFFRQLTPENFDALLVQELGHRRRLDEVASTPTEERLSRAAMANGPELLVHIAAGNVPNPTLMGIVLGLLTRSAQFVKCARGTSFLPRLFAHSLYEADPKLGACLEIAEWRGGDAQLEERLFAAADCVTATGGDEALEAIRKRIPAKTRFVGYGHRVSFAYIASGSLSRIGAKKIASLAADDVVAWNQLGCLSPHLLYVEHGGGMSAEHFAELLAVELGRREENDPRGEIPIDTAATIASRRAFYEVRAAHSPSTRFWQSKDSTAWTVVYEVDPVFQLSCLNRFIYVKGVTSLTQALQSAEAVRGKVSTVGLAAPEDMSRELTRQLADWGATRVCPVGQMQNPPLLWRHDGRPALADLVTWTDWETS